LPLEHFAEILRLMLHIRLDPAAAEATYVQLARGIRQLVSDGLLPPGSRLPSMRQLSRELGISVNTVYAACDLLAAENLIETRHGSGTFITRDLDAALGVNLRTRAELDAAAAPAMDWNRFSFDQRFFFRPQGPQRTGAVLCFDTARPDPALYPFDRIKQTVTSMLWNPQELFFDRGSMQGFQPLVDHLEKEMALSGVAMAEGENDIILTGGFQRGLSIVIRHLLRPGQRVAVEAPGFTGVINLLTAERIGIVPIPMDDEGMDTRVLQETLEHGAAHAVIVTPTFHNPTGAVLSQARRRHLLRLAAQHEIPVIEDDWGRELRFDGPALPPLKALDTGGHVVHIGTFSKTFLPGLRIGWLTCPSALARNLLYSKAGSDAGDSYFLQAFLYDFIRRGHYARHVRHCVREYRKRCQAMCRALERHLPAGCSFGQPTGGLSLWLRLPAGMESLRLLPLAQAAGVSFLPAVHCMPDRSDTSALRLSFSRCSITEIEHGVALLAQAIASYDRAGMPESPPRMKR
jgi:GntR family transcriptional regulator/MocR family aminotransferase